MMIQEASKVLVVGASSAIARALIQTLIEDGQKVVAISRQPQLFEHDQLVWLQSDYSEHSINHSVSQLTGEPFSRVFIFNGQLHGADFMPEKRLEDFDSEKFHGVIESNTVIPMLWLKCLKPTLKGPQNCVVTLLSARIGSIGDNHLGGWYTYRASKAALNMLVKTAAVEYARVAKNTRFLLFHPGTTDSPLSKPFQKSVPDEKLFTPEFVASKLIAVANGVGYEPGVDYLDFDGQEIDW